jgi:hypothetical protein
MELVTSRIRNTRGELFVRPVVSSGYIKMSLKRFEISLRQSQTSSCIISCPSHCSSKEANGFEVFHLSRNVVGILAINRDEPDNMTKI